MNIHNSVLLLHHPTNDTNRPVPFPAMGLFGIADFLTLHRIPVRIVHIGVEKRVDPRFDILEFISHNNFTIVAISVHWYFQLPDSLDVARRIKNRFPHIFILLGGFTASFFSTDILIEHPFIDAVVHGEGELPLFELCKSSLPYLSDRLSNIPNLVFRDPVSGLVKKSKLIYRAHKELLDSISFSNFRLLNNFEFFIDTPLLMTRRFKDRILSKKSIFPLEIGRGCPHFCSFCGGNRLAQEIIHHRSSPIMRSVESVFRTIQEAVSYGYETFYIGFDPYPRSRYYSRLFRLIRNDKRNIKVIFGCWFLPSRTFIDELSETFADALLEISPETAVESIRQANKGPLSFSNEDLRKCLTYIDEKGLVCQLFFCYFLPGDSPDSISETIRMVHRYNAWPSCEVFYLALSTDPGSLFYLDPAKYDIDIEAKSLNTYLELLAKERATPNLLAHRPSGISKKDAGIITAALNLDQVIQKYFPRTFDIIRLLHYNLDSFERKLEKFCYVLAETTINAEPHSLTNRIVNGFRDILETSFEEANADSLDLLVDFIDYEATPYIESEKAGFPPGLHYTTFFVEVDTEKGAKEDLGAGDGILSAVRAYRFDVPKLLKDIAAKRPLAIERKPIQLQFVINREKQFGTFYL